MFNRGSILLMIALALPPAVSFAVASDESLPPREDLIDIEVDDGVTDPRGDESPNPRVEDLVCENVVCGDEPKDCTTCGKSTH